MGVTCKWSRFFFFQNTVWNDPASSYLGAMRKASRGTREKPARAPAPCSAWWWGWWWWWWRWRRRRCCAGRDGAGAAARTLLGGRYTPPGNSRGCPAGGDGARRARSGGGAPWRAAGQGGTERPASPLGTLTPTPPPAKLELGIVSRSSGEACFCAGIPRSWALLQLAARAQFRNPGRAPGRGGAS